MRGLDRNDSPGAHSFASVIYIRRKNDPKIKATVGFLGVGSRGADRCRNGSAARRSARNIRAILQSRLWVIRLWDEHYYLREYGRPRRRELWQSWSQGLLAILPRWHHLLVGLGLELLYMLLECLPPFKYRGRGHNTGVAAFGAFPFFT